MKTRIGISALAIALGLGSFSFAQVTGSVKLDGAAPEMKPIDMSGVKECNDQHADPVIDDSVVVGEKGELANVVVSLKKEEGQDVPGDVPAEPAILDQKGCMYVPHVLPVMVGQVLEIRNDDAFLHNVHSLASENPAFNFGQPNKDPGKKVDAMKAVETFKIKCDVHPWMAAYMVVVDNPYFATTGEDGTFSIKGVPDGEYTFVAWHEKFGTQEGKVEVKDGKGAIDFTFNSEGAAAEPAPAVQEVKLASQTKEVTCDESHCSSVVKADEKSTVAKNN